MMLIRKMLLLCWLCTFAIWVQAQDRDEVYASIEALLDKEDWQQARAKALQMHKDEDWSAIPSYQLARTHFLELQSLSLYDSAAQQQQVQKIDEYLVAVFRILPEKKSVRKDEEYWKAELLEQQIVAQTPEAVVSLSMQMCRDFKKGVDFYGKEANIMRVTMSEMQRLYKVCEDELLDFQAKHDNLKYFYLTTTPAEKDSLRAVQQHGERVKVLLKTYDKIWESLEGVPGFHKQKFEWKLINPNARNYSRYDPEDFEKETVELFDFAQWAGTLANKVAQVHHLGEEADLLYTRFLLQEEWTAEGVKEGHELINDWVKRMGEYGRVEGTAHVLRTELKKGEFMAEKQAFLKKDADSYLHKTLRDKMLDRLVRKLDTMRALSQTVYPDPRSYAYQTYMIDRISRDGQMIAQRDEIFKFTSDQEQSLRAIKLGSVHLPPEFPDSLFYQGRVVWLRPGKRDAKQLYERGVFITESVKEGGGALAVEGRYKTSNGKMPFLMLMDINGQVQWLQEFKEDGINTDIMPRGVEVGIKRKVLYYRKKEGAAGYWLEGRTADGKLSFEYDLKNIPVRRLPTPDRSAVWMVWKTGKGKLGVDNYKAAQVSWTGENLKSGTFGLNGDICNVVSYGEGVHIVGNFRKFVDWSGTVYKSNASSGHGTNVFCATLDSPELTRQRIIESPITIYANAAMFDPSSNIMRFLGYKGDIEFDALSGKAKGDTEWQEYINP